MFTKVQWEVPYVAQTSYTKSSDTMQDLEGVFRDRGKWTVVVNSERGGIPHQFFVGRFDIEDEAIAAFNRVRGYNLTIILSCYSVHMTNRYVIYHGVFIRQMRIFDDSDITHRREFADKL